MLQLVGTASRDSAMSRVRSWGGALPFQLRKGDEASRPALREEATGFLRVRMWGINAYEPHRNALAAGDLILVYLGAPERKFIGRAELASAVHDWTPSAGHPALARRE